MLHHSPCYLITEACVKFGHVQNRSCMKTMLLQLCGASKRLIIAGLVGDDPIPHGPSMPLMIGMQCVPACPMLHHSPSCLITEACVRLGHVQNCSCMKTMLLQLCGARKRLII
jgi:hypothetical protein